MNRVAHVTSDPAPPPRRPRWRGLGIIAPYDFVLDRELWQWAPDNVALHVTRTPFIDAIVDVETMRKVAELAMVTAASRDLSAASPLVTAYACTSGSFVHGLQGERQLRAAMREGGAVKALTTSGALLEALEVLGVRTLAVATPYDAPLTELLVSFLGEAGVEVCAVSNLDLHEHIFDVDDDGVVELAHRVAHPDADAIFLACTNLNTIGVVPQLEELLDRPVLSANQVTMWASLRAMDVKTVDRPERLFAIA